MRILAIGDIHGCLVALNTLLDLIKPHADDQFIFLGDYVDRGSDSRGVIERMLDLRQTYRVVFLRGNHDLMMIRARDDPAERNAWFFYGGDATLTSYAPDGGRGIFADVPASHWDFLESGCVLWHETEKHLFVHATANPDCALAEQPEYALLWERLVEPRPHVSGKVMVCGHTAQRSGVPLNLQHTICIDTFVYADGWLTCLDVTTGYVWQANERGQTREFHIDDAVF